MKKPLLLSMSALLLAQATFAQFSEFRNSDAPSQFTLNSDNNTLTIGGRVSFFYEWRNLKTGAGTTSDNKHDGFWPKDMDIDFLGKTTNKFIYELHLSPLDITTAAVTGNDPNVTTFTNATPDAPGIKAAYVEYDGFKIHIKLGYDKVPFSQSSLSDSYNTPFWDHPFVGKGDLFNRRDLGITLNTKFMNEKINVYAGAYTGVGEEVFQYGEDASGSLEYIARVEFSPKGKMNYKIIDLDGAQKPTFRIGANVRYTDKNQPGKHTITADIPNATGGYGLNFVQGYKTVYGIDFIGKYKGWSIDLEDDIVQAKPHDPADPLFNGTAETFNKGVVNASGCVAGLNYNWMKKKSVFSFQYQWLDVNDLVKGHQEWMDIGYAYTVSRFNSVFKIEWFKPTVEDYGSNPLKYNDEIRIGYQIVF